MWTTGGASQSGPALRLRNRARRFLHRGQRAISNMTLRIEGLAVLTSNGVVNAAVDIGFASCAMRAPPPSTPLKAWRVPTPCPPASTRTRVSRTGESDHQPLAALPLILVRTEHRLAAVKPRQNVEIGPIRKNDACAPHSVLCRHISIRRKVLNESRVAAVATPLTAKTIHKSAARQFRASVSVTKWHRAKAPNPW